MTKSCGDEEKDASSTIYDQVVNFKKHYINKANKTGNVLWNYKGENKLKCYNNK